MVYLEYATNEHLHDIAKFMFAFSIFWTYLWFSQYMLIWYSNQPEETIYFIQRIGNSVKASPYAVYLLADAGYQLHCSYFDIDEPRFKKKLRHSYIYGGIDTVWSLAGFFTRWCSRVFSPDHVPFILYDFGVALGFCGIDHVCNRKSIEQSADAGEEPSFCKGKFDTSYLIG
ncbi:MAG: hypothetical protein WDN26_06735 [Chitinophagaceae bacterium]